MSVQLQAIRRVDCLEEALHALGDHFNLERLLRHLNDGKKHLKSFLRILSFRLEPPHQPAV